MDIQVFRNYILLTEIVDGINDIIKNITFLYGVGILADYCLITVEFFSDPDNLYSKLSMLFPLVVLSVMMIAASVTRKVYLIVKYFGKTLKSSVPRTINSTPLLALLS